MFSLVGHSLTGLPAERIFNEKGLRKGIKNMLYGIVFGKARDGMYDYVVNKVREIEGDKADLIGITREGTEAQHDAFFQKYVVVRYYMDKMREQIETLGYVETIFGFRREINRNDESRSTQPENQAVNTPVQGSAHTILLICLALIHMKPRRYNLLQVPVMEVHDELVFWVKLRDLVESYKQFMGLFQEDVPDYVERHWGRKLSVPILAEAQAGFTLGSRIEYEGEPVEEFLPRWRAKQREIEALQWSQIT